MPLYYRLTISILFLLPTVCVHAQAPGLINYQAVARNTATGAELVNQAIFLQALIRSNGPQGTVVYAEDHPDVATNAFGLFNLQIGGGDILSGNLAEVNWAANTHWLEILIDAGGGLESIGSMQLVTVPYAFHANTATNVDDADADPTNELISSFDYNESNSTLSITEAGNTYVVNLQALAQDDDPDPTNELITSANFDPETATLSIEDAGNTFNIDLSALIDDADADPNNERISLVAYNAASNTLSITEGGQVYSAGLGPPNLDPDPTNELIDPDSFVLNDNFVLQISEAGILHQVDLTPLTQFSPWTLLPDENVVFNSGNSIGIGTEQPEAKLHIRQEEPNQEILRITNSQGNPLMQAGNDGIRFREASGVSFEGQIRLKPTIIEQLNIDPLTYDVLPDDNVLVVYSVPTTGGLVSINMPDATDHPGRVLYFRRTGVQGSVVQVDINFLPGQSDQINDNIQFFGNTPVSATLLSLGALGWTRLD